MRDTLKGDDFVQVYQNLYRIHCIFLWLTVILGALLRSYIITISFYFYSIGNLMFNFSFKILSRKTTAIVATALITSASAFSIMASDVSSVAPASIAKVGNAFNADFIKNKLETSLQIKVDQVLETPMPGIAIVISNQGILYASYDGNFIINGKVFQIDKGITDLSEKTLAKIRLDGVDQFADDMIVYRAKDEKHVVTIFTDITCGYCRKLHAQMDEYNALGITVQYLAFPRSGLFDRTGQQSQGYRDLISIWCNENPADAMTKAKNGSKFAYRTCDKPIDEHYAFGQKIGVSGTPAIILADGTLLPGYKPPADLASVLNRQ
jgi:thiol:disulfide interchange protein DsbC